MSQGKRTHQLFLQWGTKKKSLRLNRSRPIIFPSLSTIFFLSRQFFFLFKHIPFLNRIFRFVSPFTLVDLLKNIFQERSNKNTPSVNDSHQKRGHSDTGTEPFSFSKKAMLSILFLSLTDDTGPTDHSATDLRWIITYECSLHSIQQEAPKGDFTGEITLYTPGPTKITLESHKRIKHALMLHIMEHSALSDWINQQRRVAITSFQLQYRDRYNQVWSETQGFLNECPKICWDYKDNQSTCRLYAIFDLAATTNPMIPYTPAIHIPDLHHVCLEKQTPSPTISVTNSQEITEELYVISIPPLHHSKCMECKTICLQRIRQGLRALMPTGAFITEYGTFSTWGSQIPLRSDPISLQAQSRGWTHLPSQTQTPMVQSTERIPNEVWDTLDRDNALCTIHKIRYFPTVSDRPLIQVAMVQLDLDHTQITLHRTRETPTHSRNRLFSTDSSGSEGTHQDGIEGHADSPRD